MARTATQTLKTTSRGAELARNIAHWEGRSQSTVVEDALLLYADQHRAQLAGRVEEAHHALLGGREEMLKFLTGADDEELAELGMLE